MTMLDLDLTLLDELEFEPACEGETHDMGLNGHVPAEPASWEMHLRCGHVYLMCHGWVRMSQHFNGGAWYFSCRDCGKRSFSYSIGFYPLKIEG